MDRKTLGAIVATPAAIETEHLSRRVPDKILVNAAGAIVLCMAVVGLCRQFAVHIERETAISIARGLLQMVFVGIVLAALLHGSFRVGAIILLGMIFAAAATTSRRAEGIRGSLLLSFYAIAAGAGVVIAAMLATGALTTDISVLVPVGSMMIASGITGLVATMLMRSRAFSAAAQLTLRPTIKKADEPGSAHADPSAYA